jgi:hypothetical protein
VYRSAPTIQADGRSAAGRPLPIANLTLQFMTKPAEYWSCMDVQAWLHSIYLGQYCAAVAASTISGPILVMMQSLDLRVELGVQSPVHRRKMLEALGAFFVWPLGSLPALTRKNPRPLCLELSTSLIRIHPFCRSLHLNLFTLMPSCHFQMSVARATQA